MEKAVLKTASYLQKVDGDLIHPGAAKWPEACQEGDMTAPCSDGQESVRVGRALPDGQLSEKHIILCCQKEDGGADFGNLRQARGNLVVLLQAHSEGVGTRDSNWEK